MIISHLFTGRRVGTNAADSTWLGHGTILRLTPALLIQTSPPQNESQQGIEEQEQAAVYELLKHNFDEG